LIEKMQKEIMELKIEIEVRNSKIERQEKQYYEMVELRTSENVKQKRRGEPNYEGTQNYDSNRSSTYATTKPTQEAINPKYLQENPEREYHSRS
jgi:hypothetical protein